MLGYPVHLTKQKSGYTATFRDIPEALTSGRTKAAALEMAADALATAMEFYLEDRRPVPSPSKPRRGEDVVELPASVAVKVLLLNEMLKTGTTPAKLARAQRVGELRWQVGREGRVDALPPRHGEGAGDAVAVFGLQARCQLPGAAGEGGAGSEGVGDGLQREGAGVEAGEGAGGRRVHGAIAAAPSLTG